MGNITLTTQRSGVPRWWFMDFPSAWAVIVGMLIIVEIVLCAINHGDKNFGVFVGQLVILALLTLTDILQFLGTAPREQNLWRFYFESKFNRLSCFCDILGWVLIFIAPAFARFRLLRVLRLLRLNDGLHSKPAGKAIHMLESFILQFGGSAFWLLLFLTYFVYLFAVILQAALAESSPSLFGTFGDSMLTMFSFATDGWSVIKPVTDAQPAYVALFLPFFIFTALGFINGLIGVFANSFEDAPMPNVQPQATGLDAKGKGEGQPSIPVTDESREFQYITDALNGLNSEIRTLEEQFLKKNGLEPSQPIEEKGPNHDLNSRLKFVRSYLNQLHAKVATINVGRPNIGSEIEEKKNVIF